MADVPVQLIIAAFQDEQGADNALAELKQAKKDQWINIQNAAVIRRDAQNKLHIKETADMGGGKGAVIGGVIGGVLGVIFPPSILVSAGLGALVGGGIAKVSDGGFSDARLKQLGEALKPGTSAIVAVIEHKWVAEAEAALAEQGAQVMVESLKADIAEQLAAGRDVTYSAVATDEALDVSRTAVGADHLEASEMLMTEEGIAAAGVVADKEGATFGAMVSDAQGTDAVFGTVTPEDTKALPAEGEAPAAEEPKA